ncbi:hypothetical protein CONCODRAFT_73220 [Conidiobolus coronatus NRRL 28638]|uniref:Alpha/beta-hydrolase n=1 Tax=Conidiobolus coronatus (strain ATCC 28846 / CBS 209.66 / NRRL 28638) TaxID=796925 RepID=A0A137NWE8_CONC2|nr:hypothetical protein CONCODRAFT_73220 [Conidiobolus coronatus NRRL 28638]|eukprot:KXN67106.1 hypothetical protein CONCODRAFT_73220 [Conidiobolus coronatus NRRL 28638]
MPQYFPDTVKALASTCIDYIPPAENWIELDDLIKINPVFEYQRDIAYKNWETECKENKKQFFEVIYQYQGIKPGVEPPSENPGFRLVDVKTMYEGVKYLRNYDPMFTDEEFDYLLSQYSDQVIANSCNYYRTRLLNYKDEREISDHYIHHPVLMVHSTGDITNKFFIDRDPPTKEYCKNLTFKSIEGDHWIILNKKDEVNTHIHEWLKELKF